MLRRCLAVAGLMLGLSGAAALAQDGPQPPRGGERGDRGDRGPRGERPGRNFDPAEMRERMLNGIREQMQLGDEEWQVVKPKLERVINAQREARGGGAGGFGPRGPRGGPGGPGGGPDDQQPTSEIAKASRDLRAALQDASLPAATIAEKLEAYRAARKKADAELAAAREDLKSVLTQRQEAQFVLMGMLE